PGGPARELTDPSLVFLPAPSTEPVHARRPRTSYVRGRRACTGSAVQGHFAFGREARVDYSACVTSNTEHRRTGTARRRSPTELDDAADRYIERLAALSPMSATAPGIPGDDTRLDAFSPPATDA